MLHLYTHLCTLTNVTAIHQVVKSETSGSSLVFTSYLDFSCSLYCQHSNANCCCQHHSAPGSLLISCHSAAAASTHGLVHLTIFPVFLSQTSAPCTFKKKQGPQLALHNSTLSDTSASSVSSTSVPFLSSSLKKRSLLCHLRAQLEQSSD